MARVTMVLVRGPGRPEGDLADRLELTVALTPQGALDDASPGAEPWRALRLRPGGEQRPAELVRAGAGWALQGAADAPLWGFEGTVFRPGEYVTLRPPGDDELVFRIVDVRPD